MSSNASFKGSDTPIVVATKNILPLDEIIFARRRDEYHESLCSCMDSSSLIALSTSDKTMWNCSIVQPPCSFRQMQEVSQTQTPYLPI